MAAELYLDDLVSIVVGHVRWARTSLAQANLLRLVHGDERVPSTVKDEHVLAALAVAVTRGDISYSMTRFDSEDRPLVNYGKQDQPW